MQRFFHKDSKTMKLMTVLADIVHIQVLWIAFTLVGLVVGGVFPATIAMFALLRRIIRSGNSFEINREFWIQFKSNFIKANLLGYGIIIVGLLLRLHYNYSLNIEGTYAFLFSISSLALWFIFLFVILYIPPTYVHFDINNFQVIKHAFIIAISTPFHSLGMVIFSLLFYWSSKKLPVLMPFLSIGLLSYGIMKLADHAFSTVNKVSEKNNKIQNV